jgi:hypothetical protein
MRDPSNRLRTSLFVAIVVSGSAVTVSAASAQREVHGTILTSPVMPVARLALDSTLSYVGTQTVMLSPTTRAEQHFFVESDRGRVKRLYWVQFEGKLEGRGRPYDYSNDPTIEFAGQVFHTNHRFYPTSGFAGRAGSDGDHAQQLLERAGLTLGTDLMRVRLVWLLDDPPRNELMIIYLEDLADHGLTVVDLRKEPERWADVATGLRRRALHGMRLVATQRRR